MAREFELSGSLPDMGEDIDSETFGQIYDMDEDEDHSFSLQIVEEFFEQAYETFQEMDELLEKEDLIALSERGHYLKGSSATLGLVKVKDSCERIQRFGKMEDLDGTPVEDRDECRRELRKSLARAKVECNRAERTLKGFYNLPIPDELVEEEDNDEEPDKEKAEAEKSPAATAATTEASNETSGEDQKENTKVDTKGMKEEEKEKKGKADSKAA